jgi:hypothetical protein
VGERGRERGGDLTIFIVIEMLESGRKGVDVLYSLYIKVGD